jgi:6-phosphofructokinase 1
MALDSITQGKHGLMTAIVNGCFTMSPIPDPKLGPRNVDVEVMYDTAKYMPRYDAKLGFPIFLTRA